MARAILIKKVLVLRESSFYINRDDDIVNVIVSIEPKYGEVYSPENAVYIRKMGFGTQKSFSAKGWDKVKVMGPGDIIPMLHKDLVEIFPVYDNFNRWELEPEYEDVTMDDEKVVKVRKKNPHYDTYNGLLDSSILKNDQAILDLLYPIFQDVVKSEVVEL